MISLKSIQTEIDASYLYKILAENEEDEAVAITFGIGKLIGVSVIG
jgi:hypothetical protein